MSGEETVKKRKQAAKQVLKEKLGKLYHFFGSVDLIFIFLIHCILLEVLEELKC